MKTYKTFLGHEANHGEIKPGTPEYRQIHNDYVKKWRHAGRDEYYKKIALKKAINAKLAKKK
ncbi:MAG: hypothetical protein ABSA74_03380 [Candidatus Staskawiczbacteria bacterium]|jgi:hypothetical protein